MKKIIFLICINLFFNVLQAKDEDDLLIKIISVSEDVKGAKKNKTKTKTVRDIINTAIGKYFFKKNLNQYNVYGYFNIHENEITFAKSLNTELLKNDLPTFDLKDINIIPSSWKTFGGESFAGLEIQDGSYKLCFPCENGHNNFEYSFKPVKKEKKKKVVSSVIACYKSLIRDPDERSNYNKDLDALIIPEKDDEEKPTTKIYIFSNPIKSVVLKLNTKKSIKVSRMFRKSFINLISTANNIPSIKIEYMEMVKGNRFFFTIKKNFSKSPKDKKIQRIDRVSRYDDEVKNAIEDFFKRDLDLLFQHFKKETFYKKYFLEKLAPCRGIAHFPLGDKVYQAILDYDDHVDNTGRIIKPDTVRGQ